MKHLKIDNQKIPAVGLGTWQMKGKECTKAVEMALNSGYRHIDTAQVYENEEEVGRGIENSKIDRDEIWLTTKVWRDNLNQENLKESVEESLRKLKTDYVDLLLIHWPFPEMDLEEVLNEMAEVVEEGKARNIGVSNFNSSQMEKAVELSDIPILTNQVEYHPFLDQSEVIKKSRELDMMLTAYSPLARGDVMGNDTLKRLADKYDKSEAQVSLRWLIQQKNVSAIPKASSRDHIQQNLEIFDFKLSEKEMEQISNLKENDRKIDPSFAPEWD